MAYRYERFNNRPAENLDWAGAGLTADDHGLYVKDGTKTLMRAYEISAGGLPSPGAGGTDGDNEYLIDLARDTILLVREGLSNGPFNNHMEVNGRPAMICGSELEGQTLNSKTESYRVALDEYNFSFDPEFKGEANQWKQFWAASAAYCESAIRFGGGVCASISYVTMGVLTCLAENIWAAIVYSSKAHGGYDHSFCVIRRHNTAWYVVDPWVGFPQVCPWNVGRFGPDGIGQHTLVKIESGAKDEYGVKISAEAERFAAAHLKKYNKYKQDLTLQIWDEPVNTEKSGDEYPPVAGPEDWGPTA